MGGVRASIRTRSQSAPAGLRPFPTGPLNVPITPASALHAGGTSGYARDGHRTMDRPGGGDRHARRRARRDLLVGHGRSHRGHAASSRPSRSSSRQRSPTWTCGQDLHSWEARSARCDVTDTDAVLAACEGAHVLWLESPTNPLLGIADLPRLCAFARERGMLCVVDNTLVHTTSPAPARPRRRHRHPQRHQGNRRPLGLAPRRGRRRRDRHAPRCMRSAQ